MINDKMGCALSDTQLRSFHENGFIGPFTLFDPEEMAARWQTIRGQLMDDSRSIYRDYRTEFGSTNIANYDRHFDVPMLAEHIMRREIVDKVVSILGPDVLCWRTEFFPKYKGDEGTDWHQADTFANASGKPQILWPEDEAKDFGGTITVWSAFTNSTLENGCLQLMPGTHREMNYDESKRMVYDPNQINRVDKDGKKRGFFGYDYRQLQKDPDWKPDESKAFPVVMKSGQFLIFWSTLMHASLPHRSTLQDMRLGFVGRYVPTRVRVYPDTDAITEYGGRIGIEKHANVLVAGTDTYRHHPSVML